MDKDFLQEAIKVRDAILAEYKTGVEVTYQSDAFLGLL